MQGKKLYVGNLKYSVTNEDLENLFSQYGEVADVKVIEGKGFGFIEMSTQSEAEEAKEALNNNEYQGRPLRVDEARPPKSKSFGYNRRY
ncbi:MAG: RNA recognition motif domain-containing protein [bacterium]